MRQMCNGMDLVNIKTFALLLLLSSSPFVVTAASPPADMVLIGARIYTATAQQDAQAIAIRDGKILYVGNANGAKTFTGPKTILYRATGHLIIPGLVDAHMHPADIVDLDVCDLNSKSMNLRALSGFVKRCLEHYHTATGARLLVHQWDFTDGNLPEPGYPTLRAALDEASTTREIQLIGDDGHHGAFNSLALAHAKDSHGNAIGISKGSLAGEFAMFTRLIGVDERGEPNGMVNEDARYTINPRSMTYQEYDAVLAAPEKIPQRLNSVGITAIMDAMADPSGLPIWDKLLSTNHLTAYVTLAQFYDPSHTLTADGHIDYDGLVSRAEAVRAKYAQNPLLRADFIKLFADGVIEANPVTVPPTLGNAAVLRPYLQPIFGREPSSHLTVTGYVDTASPACVDAREHPERYTTDAAISQFTKDNGFHPGQCLISDGQLQHKREVELEYAKRMHLAGFNLHIHAIGDRAVRTAVDAIEAARAADGINSTRDSLAHVQIAHPDDIARIGRDHLFVANTYSWATVDLDYDMLVIPFIQEVIGNSYESRHVPGSYYEENTYPFRSTKEAGAILVAGSDAPVGGRDPRPFVNMYAAITRHIPGQPALNPKQAITIRDVLEAYTIDGAKFLGRDAETGSIEVGKSADFAILDRDILSLADTGHPDDIAGTRVLETWFRGKRVFRAKQVQKVNHGPS